MKLKDKPTKKEIIEIVEAIGIEHIGYIGEHLLFRDLRRKISKKTEVYVDIPFGCTFKDLFTLIKEVLYCYIP